MSTCRGSGRSSTSGVTTVDGRYRPTAAADSPIGSKPKIPVGYPKWLRSQQRTDLYDAKFSPKVSALGPGFLANYRNPFADPELATDRRRVAGQLDRWRPIAAREGLSVGELWC
ncbi:hypothetical protein [Nocardia lijiangensis]|uniref:hypothetical protein n=1 Tax=Nocardia lijiangensis TaxID=299618 RepID=UPI0008318FE3|nr:hypothetical protein [Nocardia lijiangensis]